MAIKFSQEILGVRTSFRTKGHCLSTNSRKKSCSITYLGSQTKKDKIITTFQIASKTKKKKSSHRSNVAVKNFDEYFFRFFLRREKKTIAVVG